MALRFRKSVKVAPGVRLNIGKKSVGVSAGVKGYRKSINSSGRITTSVGVPGSGVSYVTTKNVKKSSKKTPSGAASVVSSSSAAAVVSSPAQSVKKPAAVARLNDPPGVGNIVLAVIAFVIAFFASGSSWLLAIAVAAFGVWCIIAYIAYKKHPDRGNYISEDQLECWRQLLSVAAGSSYELRKASLPVLLSLKEEINQILTEYPGASNKSECGARLLEAQQKIVDFSEFVILKDDDPAADLEKYREMIEN